MFLIYLYVKDFNTDKYCDIKRSLSLYIFLNILLFTNILMIYLLYKNTYFILFLLIHLTLLYRFFMYKKYNCLQIFKIYFCRSKNQFD